MIKIIFHYLDDSMQSVSYIVNRKSITRFIPPPPPKIILLHKINYRCTSTFDYLAQKVKSSQSVIAFQLHIIHRSREPIETVTVNSHGNYNGFYAREQSSYAYAIGSRWE